MSCTPTRTPQEDMGLGAVHTNACLQLGFSLAFKCKDAVGPHDSSDAVQWRHQGGSNSGVVENLGASTAEPAPRELHVARSSGGSLVTKTTPHLDLWIDHQGRSPARASLPCPGVWFHEQCSTPSLQDSEVEPAPEEPPASEKLLVFTALQTKEHMWSPVMQSCTQPADQELDCGVAAPSNCALYVGNGTLGRQEQMCDVDLSPAILAPSQRHGKRSKRCELKSYGEACLLRIERAIRARPPSQCLEYSEPVVGISPARYPFHAENVVPQDMRACVPHTGWVDRDSAFRAEAGGIDRSRVSFATCPHSRAQRVWCHFYLHMSVLGFGVVSRVIGRGGCNTSAIARATGAKVRVRGRGSGHMERATRCEAHTPLMLAVTANTRNISGFERALVMAVSLLRNVGHSYVAHCWNTRIKPQFPCFEIGDASGNAHGSVRWALSGEADLVR